MSRIALFILFAVWAVGSESDRGRLPTGGELALFLGGFALLVGLLCIWGYRVRNRSQTRFLWAIWIGRQVIAGWFAVGIFWLHWPDQVAHWLGPAIMGPRAKYPIESLPAFVGTLPALLAWVGILVAKYPSERIHREERILDQLDNGLPVHAPAGLRSFLSAHLRMDLLFIVVPIGMILLARDIALLGVLQFWPAVANSAWAEPTISLGSALVVFLVAPMLLTQVLDTRPLPPSPLRTRLELMCTQAGLKYRQILLWHTDNHLGNAAVMGVIPQVRYILLSDLLLETMSDEQIEAVFAHELGHVVHKHLTWSGLFVVVLLLAAYGPGSWVYDLSAAHLPHWLTDVVLPGAGLIGGLLILFGWLSRHFERQADVYAARTIESHHRPSESRPEISLAPRQPVGSYGANLFASALYRVALINGIPIHSRTLTHGSIAGRIDYLHQLSADPAKTTQFDQMMKWIYRGVVALLVACGVWAAVVMSR